MPFTLPEFRFPLPILVAMTLDLFERLLKGNKEMACAIIMQISGSPLLRLQDAAKVGSYAYQIKTKGWENLSKKQHFAINKIANQYALKILKIINSQVIAVDVVPVNLAEQEMLEEIARLKAENSKMLTMEKVGNEHWEMKPGVAKVTRLRKRA